MNEHDTAQEVDPMAAAPDPTDANLYKRLGVTHDATLSQINTAYRQLARALHPDSAQTLGGDPGALRQVIDAHQILSDADRRQRYDSTDNTSRRSIPPRSDPDNCAVCGGSGAIYVPCGWCAGVGHALTDASLLRTPVICPACHARRFCIARCGACGGTGHVRHLGSRHW